MTIFEIDAGALWRQFSIIMKLANFYGRD